MIMSLRGYLALPPKDNRGQLFYSVVPSNEEPSLKSTRVCVIYKLLGEEIEDRLCIPPLQNKKLHPEKESFLSFLNLVVNTCYNLKPVWGGDKTTQKRKDLIDPSIKYDRIFLEPSYFPYTFQFDSVQAEVKSKHELFFFFF